MVTFEEQLMIVPVVQNPALHLFESTLSARVTLADGLQTTVHVTKYLRTKVYPRVVVFDKAIPLLAWCRSNQIHDAIVGGFFLRKNDKVLGEMWISGKKHDTVPFISPWDKKRGTLHISDSGHVTLAPRHLLPGQIDGDLLQAGPLLIRNGKSLIKLGKDYEGFTAGAHQFDSDISAGRYPRAAIGANDEFIWSVAVDGYGREDHVIYNVGLTFSELAEVMLALGATEALNLDGGSSSSLVSGGKLINKPRGGAAVNFERFPEGRGIHTAIIFQSRDR